MVAAPIPFGKSRGREYRRKKAAERNISKRRHLSLRKKKGEIHSAVLQLLERGETLGGSFRPESKVIVLRRGFMCFVDVCRRKKENPRRKKEERRLQFRERGVFDGETI